MNTVDTAVAGLSGQTIVDLTNDPRRRESLGRAGRAHVASHRTWSAAARAYDDIYTSLDVVRTRTSSSSSASTSSSSSASTSRSTSGRPVRLAS